MLQNRKQFSEELKSLNEKVITMGSEVIESYIKLTTACNTKDKSLLKDIIEYDRFINDIESSINVDGYLLIAKQCPVASDLRRVITALKISNDLERIADYSVNIAKYVEKYDSHDSYIQSLLLLLRIFIGMLTDVMVAFRDENSELAIEVDKRDEILDKEYKDEIKKLIKGSNMDEDELEVAVKAILSLKQIERAGDHVTNISESIIYLITGNRVELN